MMEHALFIRRLLDPSENALIEASNNFANDYTYKTIASITNETLNKTLEFKDFKVIGTKGSDKCQIKSIFLPLLADHVLRESNHYIRLLQNYKHMV